MTGREEIVLPTRVANTGRDDHHFAGWPVFGSLAGTETLTGFIALGLTGRRLDAEQVRILDDVVAAWTLADPRIWPLKIARLASSFGGVLQGFAASILCLENKYVGTWQSSPDAARFLLEVKRALGERSADADAVAEFVRVKLAGATYIPGFGVPFRQADERLPPLRRCLEAHGGYHRRPFWVLFETIAAILRQDRSLEPNMAGGWAAVALDLGLEPNVIGPLSIALGTHMFMANALEGARQAPALLQRLPDACVRYVGKPPRLSPRATAAQAQATQRSR